MMMRTLVLALSALVLASCAGFGQCPGYGACTGRGTTGPYDLADLYTGPNGKPIPGFEALKYGNAADSNASQ